VAGGHVREVAGILDAVVMADQDETCPGVWVQLDREVGYCELGDDCRNPIRQAHSRQIDETVDIDSGEE
jgi:hypothetical protein